ncbi:zinc finger protein 862-like [Pleurodeles waltl]|uniref:zinc finger protein 862-like n=1 Tax=Pleurodeles waltl TaxID=8319 RepID=UPI0037097455
MLVTAAVEHCAPLLEASSLQEPLGDMSGQQPEEVVFCNASAYFSAEEWKRFDEWQKALYRNVMKEIHHALLLLVSPNLSTRVCLKKEEEPISIFIDHLGEKVGQTSKSLDIGPGDADTQRTATLWKEMDLTLRKEQKATHSYRGLETHLYAYLQIQTLLNAGS